MIPSYRLHLLMDWKWAVQLGCLCLLEAVEAGWVVLAEVFEEEGWVEWEPGSVGLYEKKIIR